LVQGGDKSGTGFGQVHRFQGITSRMGKLLIWQECGEGRNAFGRAKDFELRASGILLFGGSGRAEDLNQVLLLVWFGGHKGKAAASQQESKA
jgi:hypothetical protein